MHEHRMHQHGAHHDGCRCGDRHGGGDAMIHEHRMHDGWADSGVRRRRSPRGRVRREMLILLQDGPKHGYELMQLISERNGGVWQPSPGSIYPTLSMLEDAGLIVGREEDGRKVYTLTDAGRSEAEVLMSEPDAGGGGREVDLGREIRATFQALRQVGMVGTVEQRQRALQLLAGLRRDIYRMLAEDPPSSDQ
jgi:DNA-binding PadR family transcriptional regulator